MHCVRHCTLHKALYEELHGALHALREALHNAMSEMDIIQERAVTIHYYDVRDGHLPRESSYHALLRCQRWTSSKREQLPYTTTMSEMDILQERAVTMHYCDVEMDILQKRAVTMHYCDVRDGHLTKESC